MGHVIGPTNGYFKNTSKRTYHGWRQPMKNCWRMLRSRTLSKTIKIWRRSKRTCKEPSQRRSTSRKTRRASTSSNECFLRLVITTSRSVTSREWTISPGSWFTTRRSTLRFGCWSGSSKYSKWEISTSHVILTVF